MQIIIDKKSNAWARINVPLDIYNTLKRLKKEWRLGAIWKVIAILLEEGGYYNGRL